MNFFVLTKMISPCALITFGTKFINKLIYALVNLVLNTLQKFLLLISHRNSYCESILSGIGKNFTDGRHNLGKDGTQGHASTSVYTETRFIRNNLLAIMIPRKA